MRSRPSCSAFCGIPAPSSPAKNSSARSAAERVGTRKTIGRTPSTRLPAIYGRYSAPAEPGSVDGLKNTWFESAGPARTGDWLAFRIPDSSDGSAESDCGRRIEIRFGRPDAAVSPFAPPCRVEWSSDPSAGASSAWHPLGDVTSETELFVADCRRRPSRPSASSSPPIRRSPSPSAKWASPVRNRIEEAAGRKHLHLGNDDRFQGVVDEMSV